MALQRVRSNMLANNFVLDDDQGLIVGSGNNIYIDTVNNRVGINTNSPTHDLTVSGNIHATGTITAAGDITLGDSDADTLTITAEIGSDILPDIDNTYDLGSTGKKWAEVHATSFYGDGSNLTGITSSQVTGLTTDNVAEGSNLYYTDARADARATLRITAADIGNLNNVDETGVSNGKVLKYNSTSTNWEVGDADLVADTTPQLGGNLDLNSNDITGTGNINITGDVTATNFIGDGSQLTGLASTLDEVTTNGATTTNSITIGGLIVNSTGAVDLPVGTTAQRPTAADGQIRFNSDLVAFEGYDGTEWGALGGGGATYSTTAPTTNLKTGDLWFDTGTTGELYVYSGSEWLSTTGASGSAFYSRSFTGDNTTVAFTVGGGTSSSAADYVGSDYVASNYVQGGSEGSTVLVYLNGVLLTSPADYSYSGGVVTFVTAPPLNSEILILVYSAASGVSLALGDLTDVNLSVAPTDGQAVVWDNANSQWIAGDSFSQSDFNTAFTAKNTDDLSEGSTNLYYTDARVQTKLGDVSGHIIPDTDVAYDLGSTTNKFRDLYLSGSSITLGTRTITQDNVPEVDLSIAPEVLEIQVDSPAAGQDINWLWTWEQSTLPYARRTITNSNEAQVPLYKQGTYVVNNFAAYTTHGSMTQTHSLYLKWIDGAGTDNLVSWATSAGPISDTHPDINGGSATDVQRITVNVPTTITPPTLTAPSVDYTVANNANGAYTFSGPASGDNPNIGPLYRGGTYTFDVSASGHPFYLTTDNGTNFSAGTYFGEYTSGVTNSRTDSGTVTFVVPSNAPDTLYYQCGNHSAMRGAITIKDLAVETNINGNYVVYFQHTQEGHKTPVELRPIPSLVNQMCLVYDSSVNRFVPQDLATYVENTPSFENKIREVAGTAELVVEDGSAVVAKVNVYDDSTYLPLTGNNPGDQAFATDNNILYIWDGSAWQQAGATNTDEITEGTTNLFYTDARADARVNAGIATLVDSAPSTLDTLNELAAALGDDPNFATTVTNNIATKAPLNNPTFTGVITGDGSGLTGIPSGITRTAYVATANQTTFSATYTTGNVDVFLNGVKLVRTTEFDDTSGTSIVLASGANVGDNVEIVIYNSYNVADTVSASAGGTFASIVTLDGNAIVNTGAGQTDPTNTLQITRPSASDYSGISFRTAGTTDWSIGQNSRGGFTVYEDGADSTTRLIIKDGGNVGIGTYTPGAKLDVAGNLHVGANGSTVPSNFASNLDFLQVGAATFIQAGTDAQGFIKSNHYWNGAGTSYVNQSHGSTTVRLNENNDGIFDIETAPASGTATQTSFRIDNAGNVTTPRTPMFCYNGNTSQWIQGASSATWYRWTSGIGDLAQGTATLGVNLTANQLGSKAHSGFNVATGRFTAPEAGMYLFHVSAYVIKNSASTNYIHPNCEINGSVQNDYRMFGRSSGSGYDYGDSFDYSWIRYLNANDTFAPVFYHSGSNDFKFYGDYCRIEGFLLG